MAGMILGGLVVAHRWRRRALEFRRDLEAERQTAETSRDQGLRRAAAAGAALERLQTVIDRQARSLLEDQEGVRERHQLLKEATCEMASRLREVGCSIEHLSSSTEETSSSVFEMVATIEEIARHIEEASAQVNETAASTTSLVNTIKGVDTNVERLKTFVVETSGTMEQVTGAIRQVESRTADSNQLSHRVAANADEGMKAVQSTIEGMNRIRSSVVEAGEAIAQLGRRSQDIGGILNVIDEVAEQTNLLALNAAIIAAQAGEHGKGFAVVADEIRGLAERTASSTREIGSLIESFRQEAGRARQCMEDGSRQVQDGSALAESAGAALTKILDSSRESSRMAGEIAQTTQEQVQGTQIVVEAVGRVREMVTQLSAITAEQTARSESIMATVGRMRELTEQVNRATLEQAKGGSLITEAIRSVTDNVASIHQATLRQDTENDRIAAALAAFGDAGEGSQQALRQIADAGRELLDLTQTLTDEDVPAPTR
jgi:methyl-accepting chemotaxis protein